MMISTQTERSLEEFIKQAAHCDTTEMAKYLAEGLTPQLAAFMANVNSSRTIESWAQGQVNASGRSIEYMRATYAISAFLLQYDAPKVVRSWFVGRNPILNTSPAKAIRAGHFDEAYEAAREFAATG